MQQITVISATQLLQAVKSGETVLRLKEKSGAKVYKGAKFFDVRYLIDGKLYDGWFRFSARLTAAPADPTNISDYRNEFASTRNVLQTSLSNAGEFGEALVELNKQWMAAAKQINIGNRAIHELLQFRTSTRGDTTVSVELEDPTIRMKLATGSFPQNYKYKFLAGKPRVQFFDGRTGRIEGAKQVYDPATITTPDGRTELVTIDNMHKFIGQGARVEIRVHMGSAALSAAWFSIPMEASWVVVWPGPEAGFSDDLVQDVDINALQDVLLTATLVERLPTAHPIEQPIEQPAAQPVDQAPAVQPLDPLDDFLNDI